MFQVFKFSLSALPSLPPALLSEHSLSVSLLALLPATHQPYFCEGCFEIGSCKLFAEAGFKQQSS
jgi:hypothetical protein